VRVNSGTAAAVVLASGSGVRVGADRNKVFLPLRGRAIVAWSLRAMAAAPGIGVLVLVVRPQDLDLAHEVLDQEFSPGRVEIVHGGATRQDSELMALRHLAPRISSGEIDVVLVHDAARPLVTAELTTAILRAAREHGGAVPGVPTEGLVRASEDGRLAEADLGTLMAMQTPQGFLAGPLLDAYEKAAAEGFYGTDTAACVSRYTGIRVRCIPGERTNMKVTYPHDLAVAATYAEAAGREEGRCAPSL
jgi:2-C-methyl-D-erythritol 4-phosphate cytidylyltransferase